MIYSKSCSYGDGQWHCPFQPEWVERMKQAALHCKHLSAARIEQTLNGETFQLCDFLSEPQDARGLPMSYCQEYEARHRNWPSCCTAIYDYDSIPNVVVSNGNDDWPFAKWEPVLRA